MRSGVTREAAERMDYATHGEVDCSLDRGAAKMSSVRFDDAMTAYFVGCETVRFCVEVSSKSPFRMRESGLGSGLVLRARGLGMRRGQPKCDNRLSTLTNVLLSNATFDPNSKKDGILTAFSRHFHGI